MLHARRTVATTRRFRLCVAMLAGAAVSALLAGCVAAESSRYRGTVSRSVAPDAAANADVAGAFGMMRDDGDSAVNMAVANDPSVP